MADAGEAEMGAPKEGSAVEGITSSAWRALAEISGRTAEELFDPLCFIENLDTDTQVPLGISTCYGIPQHLNRLEAD